MAATAPRTRIRWLRLVLRWGPPLLLVIGGLVLIVMGHAHVSDVNGSMVGVDSGSEVFTAFPTDKRTWYSTIGVSLIIIAAMWVMLLWFVRLNSGDGADRDADEAAREYYARTGRWPGEAGPRGTST